MCVHALNCVDKNQSADVSSLIFVDLSATEPANLASKSAIFVRGGALKSTLVVDNDRQCTMYIHAQLLSKCSICSGHPLTHAPHESLKKTIHGI